MTNKCNICEQYSPKPVACEMCMMQGNGYLDLVAISVRSKSLEFFWTNYILNMTFIDL